MQNFPLFFCCLGSSFLAIVLSYTRVLLHLHEALLSPLACPHNKTVGNMGNLRI